MINNDYSTLNLFTRVLLKKSEAFTSSFQFTFASLSLTQQRSTNKRSVNQTHDSQTKLTFNPSFQLLVIRSSLRFSLTQLFSLTHCPTEVNLLLFLLLCFLRPASRHTYPPRQMNSLSCKGTVLRNDSSVTKMCFDPKESLLLSNLQSRRPSLKDRKKASHL